MKRLLIVVLIVCAGLVFSAGCVTTPDTPEPVATPTPAPTPTFSPTGLTEDETLNAAGYGTHEYQSVLMKKGPTTFHATFDGPGTFTMDITLHGADVVQPFYKRGAFDETVTIDIGSTQYYYVTVTGLGNWTVVQS
ncbi:hypothetical protein McpSp1_16820 [Methanocorpusculaceae archaeon Sp1]|nr:hypothetical protein [Methanocorpusculaceae archaeon Sp1]